MHSRPLTIEVVPDGYTVTLVLRGEMDEHSVEPLRACLENLESQWRSVVLEMSGVTFIDSSGIAVLAQAHRTFGVDFRTLELRHLDERVRRVFELSGASELMPLAPPAPPLVASDASRIGPWASR